MCVSISAAAVCAAPRTDKQAVIGLLAGRCGDLAGTARWSAPNVHACLCEWGERVCVWLTPTGREMMEQRQRRPGEHYSPSGPTSAFHSHALTGRRTYMQPPLPPIGIKQPLMSDGMLKKKKNILPSFVLDSSLEEKFANWSDKSEPTLSHPICSFYLAKKAFSEENSYLKKNNCSD